MGLSLILLCLSLLIHSGVFGDPDEVKSVMEGESVTLHTDIVKRKGDLIVWTYGPDNKLLARLNEKARSTMLSKDEMFRDRLKLDDQTGSLTITHITSEHSGLYTLKIIRNNKVSYKRFSVTVYDEMKSVSVREEHSVILYTHVLKQRNDLIEWTYGPENTLVATIYVEADRILFSDDERFIGRLKLDDQTGSLMIHDITTHHSGLHTLKIISNNKLSYMKFSVTVYDEIKSLSVREGHSVILFTHVLKQGRDLIEWMHGPENTLVATIDVEANRIMFSDDERFIGRVKMNHQTGDLMIHDITSQHSGLYTLKISNNHKVSYKGLSVTIVTVNDFHVVLLCVIPVVLLICACIWVFVQKQRDDGSSKNSSTTNVAISVKQD